MKIAYNLCTLERGDWVLCACLHVMSDGSYWGLHSLTSSQQSLSVSMSTYQSTSGISFPPSASLAAPEPYCDHTSSCYNRCHSQHDHMQNISPSIPLPARLKPLFYAVHARIPLHVLMIVRALGSFCRHDGHPGQVVPSHLRSSDMDKL